MVKEVLWRQFKPSLKMISKVIETCPKAIWAQRNIDPPIWQQVYHVLYSIDYWFSETKQAFEKPVFNKEVNSVLGETSPNFIEQEDMVAYLKFVEEKAHSFFMKLNSQTVTEASNLYVKWSNLDVVLEQFRHLQHHMGYLNRVLLKCKIKPVEWELYEEEG